MSLSPTSLFAGPSPNPGSRAVLLAIRGYQWALSPWLGPACRFHPSCSSYPATCVERFGAARGLWLGARRIVRCHPFHPGGFDAPPDAAAGPEATALVPAAERSHGQP
jgi:putative membrane protein insertion efficiency factor